jgi:hypothetical protein
MCRACFLTPTTRAPHIFWGGLQQFSATVEEKTFSGSAPRRAAATMGRANGLNAEHPYGFLRKHAKEPVLPERE